MRALAGVAVVAILPLAAAHADDPAVVHVTLDVRKLPGHWVRAASGEGYESKRGRVGAFIDVLRLPGTEPAGWLKLESDRYRETGLNPRSYAADPAATGKSESACIFADGYGGSLRVVQCTYRSKSASTFFAIEYRETSAGEGDERSFTRAARQLQRAALEQSGID